MSDPNEKRKKAILDRAKHSGNHKVEKYVEEGLLPKVDQLNAHAGIFLEDLEASYDEFAKPQGMLHGFVDKDFDVLFKVLFGIERK
jgi:hypothetical protein